MAKKKKILFINFGGLGDEILFLPTILSVKAQYPDTEITLALEERSKGILQLTDIIDKVHCVNIKGDKYQNLSRYKKLNKILIFLKKSNELLKLLFKIWGENYDLLIASGGNKLITLFVACTLIPKRIGFNTCKLSKYLLTKAVDLNKNQYAVNMYQDLASPLTDIKTELPVLNIQKRQTIPNTVLIHPGVSKISIQQGMIKTISPQEWANVIKILANSGKKVLLAGGPDDKECIEIIQNTVPQELYKNFYGKTKNLKELAELISVAEKFVCSDSAPLHIAVALGVKTYAIFGSTDDKKLIPQNGLVMPIKATCKCPLQPCLWEKRQTTCNELFCLRISAQQIADCVLKSV